MSTPFVPSQPYTPSYIPWGLDTRPLEIVRPSAPDAAS
jgi:hypothetical protein